jgi:hypothetical protein
MTLELSDLWESRYCLQSLTVPSSGSVDSILVGSLPGQDLGLRYSGNCSQDLNVKDTDPVNVTSNLTLGLRDSDNFPLDLTLATSESVCCEVLNIGYCGFSDSVVCSGQNLERYVATSFGRHPEFPVRPLSRCAEFPFLVATSIEGQKSFSRSASGRTNCGMRSEKTYCRRSSVRQYYITRSAVTLEARSETFHSAGFGGYGYEPDSFQKRRKHLHLSMF